jgi:hypothetical protein
LRSFNEVNTAQNTCISYYEAEFENIANSMKNGETRTVNEVPSDILALLLGHLQLPLFVM